MNKQEYMKKYYSEHKEERNEYRKQYYQLHKEKENLLNSIYIKEHKEEIKVSSKKSKKKYYQNHKEKIQQKQTVYMRKYRQNPINRLIQCYRNRLVHALKGHTKGKSSEELLGCSFLFFKNYLETKFINGMTWKNYGKWHVDHIRPCASYDLSKKSEQFKCFNFTNLQPLWAEENLHKHASLVS